MSFSPKHTPCALVILDGFGVSKQLKGNAVASASMPTWKMLLKEFPQTELNASGQSVGLPAGFAGNSEVGHLTLGAGRAVPSILRQFHCAIDDGSFENHPLLIKRFSLLAQQRGRLHLIGLVSDGGVHSHIKHVKALFNLAVAQGVSDIFIHAFLDGRDTPPQSAGVFLEQLDDLFKCSKKGSLASMQGRFYAMDRDQNWDRTQQAYGVIVEQGSVLFDRWQDVLEKNYAAGITDEFIQPVLLDNRGIVGPGDGIVFFNFRPDRARQLATVFLDSEFSPFDRTITRKNLVFFVSTVRYKDEFKYFDNDVIFEDQLVQSTLLDEFLSQSGGAFRSFIIAETEKYAHVTYFFRGMRETRGPGEVYVLVPSIKSKDYVAHPEMSAQKITDHVVKSLKKDPAHFYLINYANPDMVGHSGDFDATVKACEYVDQQLAILYHEFVVKRKGALFITADHGKAEQVIDLETGERFTAHTANMVPLVIVCDERRAARLPQGAFSLYSVAPTILDFVGFAIPHEMSGKIPFE